MKRILLGLPYILTALVVVAILALVISTAPIVFMGGFLFTGLIVISWIMGDSVMVSREYEKQHKEEYKFWVDKT